MSDFMILALGEYRLWQKDHLPLKWFIDFIIHNYMLIMVSFVMSDQYVESY